MATQSAAQVWYINVRSVQCTATLDLRWLAGSRRLAAAAQLTGSPSDVTPSTSHPPIYFKFVPLTRTAVNYNNVRIIIIIMMMIIMLEYSNYFLSEKQRAKSI